LVHFVQNPPHRRRKKQGAKCALRSKSRRFGPDVGIAGAVFKGGGIRQGRGGVFPDACKLRLIAKDAR